MHWPVRFRARHWRCVGCCCASIRSNKIVSLDVNESLMERRLGRCRGYCFVSTSLRYTLIAPRTPLPYAPEHLIQHGVPQPPIFLFCERPKSATCHTEISTHAHHTHPNRSRGNGKDSTLYSAHCRKAYKSLTRESASYSKRAFWSG